jgi:hypothetical protein
VKTDKTTKILLALIAMGLWFNALNPWLANDSVVAAQVTGGETLTEAERQELLDVAAGAHPLGEHMDASGYDIHSIGQDISRWLEVIEREVSRIEDGTCTNDKIC